MFFLKSISLKSNNKNAWIQLSKSLYRLGLYEEVIAQKQIAEEHCGVRAEFEYLHCAALLAMGKAKEALQYLEAGLELAASKFKILQELHLDILTRKSVVDLVARYKKR